MDCSCFFLQRSTFASKHTIENEKAREFNTLDSSVQLNHIDLRSTYSLTIMASEQPTILVLSLGEPYQIECFDGTQENVLNALLEKAHVKRAKKASGGLKVLNETTPPRGIYIVTPGIMDAEHQELAGKIVEYAKAGGIVVYGGCMSSFSPPLDLGAMFRSTWALKWEAGSYHRTTVTLNPSAVSLGGSSEGLQPSYSQKTLNLKNVKAVNCWYLPTGDSHIESRVFPPTPIDSLAETPVAFRQVGEGWIGYTGDVNAEEGTTRVVLRMFNLI
jgi:hypothetical protein